MPRPPATAVALLVAVMVAGCGGQPAPESGGGVQRTPTTSTTSTPTPTAPASGVPVPDTLAFTAHTVHGGRFDGASLAGKPVVLWFWAAWCPRCRAAAGDVAAVHRDFAGRVHVVGVAGLDSGAAAMRTFVADQGIGGFVNLADDKGQIWRRFSVTTQEYYVLLDAGGEVVHKGPLTRGALRDRVTALAG